MTTVPYSGTYTRYARPGSVQCIRDVIYTIMVIADQLSPADINLLTLRSLPSLFTLMRHENAVLWKVVGPVSS